MEVASELMLGTTVTMVLPVSRASSTPVVLPADARETVLDARILLAEDNDEVREATERLLVACGAEVVTAGNAEDALKTVETGRFDVVLTDIRMPGNMNGIDLAHRLTSGSSCSGVVLYTGYTDQMDRAIALGLRVL